MFLGVTTLSKVICPTQQMSYFMLTTGFNNKIPNVRNKRVVKKRLYSVVIQCFQCTLREYKVKEAHPGHAFLALLSFFLILLHMQSGNLMSWRRRLHQTIYESNTTAGKVFDVALLLLIVASIVVVMLDSIKSFNP